MTAEPSTPAPVSPTDLADLVTRSADGALVLDPSGVLRYANPAALSLFMRSLDEMQQVPLGQLQDGAEIDVVRADGSVRVAEVRLSNTVWQDVPISLATLRDVTERRERENQAQQAQREAELMAAEHAAMLAQAQKLDALGQLTGGIAHDFNNLLSILLGSLQLLERRLPMEGWAKEQFDICLRAVKRGADLTSGLLTFAGRQALAPRPVSLAALLTETTALLRRSIEENINLVTQVESETLTVFCDEAQLQHALVNIVLNSRDALHGRSSGCITLSARRRSLSTKTQSPDAGELVEISVTDDGAGMSDKVRQRVFEPFFTSKEKGNGLGLAMVYGFVTQSGGELNVESCLGSGTTVTIALPAASETGPREHDGAAVKGRGETILVVEDEPDLLVVAVQMLQELGYETHSASNGRRAMSLLESGAKIDLLLTDVVMPGGMSGVELYDAAIGHRANLPVLFVSGHASSARREIDERSMPFLSKPYTSTSLAQAVRRAIVGAIASDSGDPVRAGG